MAKEKETLVLVYDKDRLRLKELAESEKRTMKDMITFLLDNWEKRNG